MLGKRVAVLLATMATALLLPSGVALAVAKFGGPGNDVLYGTNEPDLLNGLEGNDVLYGLGGDDSGFVGDPTSAGVLIGAEGDDTIYGGQGSDDLCAGHCEAVGNFDPKERNDLYGGGGHDGLRGAAGPDVLYGNAGDDFIEGQLNSSREDRGAGDILYGGRGNDSLFTGYEGGRGGPEPPLKDFVYCGSGTDRVLADRKDVVAGDCERVRRVESLF